MKTALPALSTAIDAVFTGTFLGSIDFDGTVLKSQGTTPDPRNPEGRLYGGDVFIAKLGLDGKHLWSRQIGDPDMQVARGVAVGLKGEVFAAGAFRGTVDLGGGPLSTRGDTDGYLVKLGP